MKKLIIGFLVLFALSIGTVCYADVIGSIYSTDIKTYINDIPVKAYNIGGKTCIPIEDVTIGYAYNDSLRTLLVTSFYPDFLIENRDLPQSSKVGKAVGKIYSTDIKTYFYNKELPGYNIGGKTCVAIEDIGNDNAYSDVGGRYVWDSKERTLRLEYLYDNAFQLRDLQNQYKYGLKIENGVAEFVPDIAAPAWITTDFSGMYNSYSERPHNVIPIYYGNTVIGYNFYSDNKYFFYSDDGNSMSLDEMGYAFNFFYTDKVEEILKEIGIPNYNRVTVINELVERMMADIIERYDEDDYSFLHLRQPTPHGSNEVYLFIRNDGSYEILNPTEK